MSIIINPDCDSFLETPMIHDVIVKVTLDCNIRCKYCYVQRNRGYEGQDHIMSRNTLKMLMIRISDYLKNNPNIDQFTFYWHGGEPLLAGRAFLKNVLGCSKNISQKIYH